MSKKTSKAPIWITVIILAVGSFLGLRQSDIDRMIKAAEKATASTTTKTTKKKTDAPAKTGYKPADKDAYINSKGDIIHKAKSLPTAKDFEKVTAPSYAKNAKTKMGVVVRVHDGDTFQVKTKDDTLKVRVYGIDAPEIGQKYGPQSRDKADKLVGGKKVILRIITTDRYNRNVSVVQTSEGLNFNEAMIKSGYAYYYRDYAKNNATFAKLEAEAKKKKAGVWADPNSEKPWKYRKDKREE